MARFNLKFDLVRRLIADVRRRERAIVERLAQVFLVVLVVRKRTSACFFSVMSTALERLGTTLSSRIR